MNPRAARQPLDARVIAPRSVLSVPGSSPRFLSSAVTSAAAALMIDLEDGVAPASRAAARCTTADALAALASPNRRLWVRINAVDTADFEADLAAVQSMGRALDALVLPKASPAAIDDVAAGTSLPVIAMIETPNGVEDAREISVHDAVEAVLFGELDYIAALTASGGLHTSNTDWAQARIVNATAAAGKYSLAGPTAATHNDGLLYAESADQAALGFAGKLCIHPAQVPIVTASFGPTVDMVAWAEQVLTALDRDGHDGAFALDGQMVDAPVIARARQILKGC
ncbi:HpcH/HpaI aldolase/citrate lyase family protein [Rhodococcus koreensis]|uniref:HpcH/HpaI aldolase/citrate lyase family protein n=1 Tax=Rhodococcus koreensis TaxID=99653 RepID=UPI00366A640D